MPPESTGAPATGAAEGATPDGSQGAGTPPATGAGAAQPPEQGLGAPGLAALVEEREARKKAERDLAALVKANAERDKAGMSELERAQAEAKAATQANAELTARLQANAIRTAAYEAASELGFRSPEVAYRLLNHSELELNAEGEPKNVKRLLTELLQKEPYLGKAAGVDYGGGNRGGTPPSTPGMNELLRAAVKGS